MARIEPDAPVVAITPDTRSRYAWLVLRVALGLLIAAHGLARWWAGGVLPFGGFLESQGFLYGLLLASAIAAFEIVGSAALIAGRLVAPLCACFAGIYAVGIALVHARAGWFVVDLGRNGAEYSVLLIVCLLLTGLQNVRFSGKS